MRINTNVASLQAQEAAKNTARNQSSSLEKLGTGLAINKASDDGAGLAIADKLRTQASSISQSISNANSASALVNIADKAMSEQSNILDIVKTKLIQAATDTTTDDGREAIRKDVTKLLEQFDNIASQTNYNGITLLQTSDTDQTTRSTGFSFQIGEESNYEIDLTASRASNTQNLGGGSTAVATVATGDTVSLNRSGATNITVAATTAAQEFLLGGDIGQISAVGADATITVTDQETIDIIDGMVAIDDAVISGSNGSYTLISGKNVDFGDFNVSNFKVAVGDGNTLDIEGNTAGGTTVTVQNLNQAVSATIGNADGGATLANIKGLAQDALSADGAKAFMNTIDESLSQLNSVRSDFGSAQNQIESSIRNLETTFTNLKAAESVIRDVDYAKESASFNKQNIIAQAGTYAMSQANAMQQNVSRLLQ